MTVELTTTPRGGLHRFTPDADAERLDLTVDAAASVLDGAVERADIRVEDGMILGSATHSSGYSTRKRPFTLHFAARAEPAPDRVRGWDDAGTSEGDARREGRRAGLVLEYDDPPADGVTLRVAISWVDQDGARANFDAELGATSFDEARQSSKEAWLDALGAVQVAGGRPRDRAVFFTALYNTMRHPTRLDDVDGRYRGIDGDVHADPGHAYYTDLPLWDSFRTTHPLYLLVAPDAQRDILSTLLTMRRDGGIMPRWPSGLSYTAGMLSTPFDSVFGGSAAKGLEGIDWDASLDVLLETALTDPVGAAYGGRGDMADYTTLGWLPLELDDETASRTLEYAWGDAGVASVARRAGRVALADEMDTRSGSWANLFDPQTRYLRGRRRDGSFEPADALDPIDYHDRSGPEYTEGTAWHWRFYVPHQAERLVEFMGGPDAFLADLETFFARSGVGRGRVNVLVPDAYYWHGNQPALHVPFLFAAAGDAARGAHYIDRIRELLYTTEPDGIPGNDDGNSLSAWYVFNALGFYPIAGTDRYVMAGAQVFSRAIVHAPGGDVAITSAPARSGDRLAADCAIDGAPTGAFVTHARLLGALVECQ